jgi:hypothetical protein
MLGITLLGLVIVLAISALLIQLDQPIENEADKW